MINSNQIKEKAIELGFDACGITKAESLNLEKDRLQSWLDFGYHGEMKWMENHFDKRTDPSLLIDNGRSLIVVLMNYFPTIKQSSSAPQIAKYAYGKDYHYIIKEKLNTLFDYIKSEIPHVNGRAFVDSAPLLERDLAIKAGLGWRGKNSLMLNRKLGSFFLIGELLIDTPLSYDTPHENSYCGTCTKCIDSCPTDAIVEPYIIDSNRCLSYWTIEHRGEFTPDTPNLNNRLFGCDICQDVCPWNKRVTANTIDDLQPQQGWLNKEVQEWDALTPNEFSTLFPKSPLKRTKYSGIMRNLKKIRSDNTSQNP